MSKLQLFFVGIGVGLVLCPFILIALTQVIPQIEEEYDQ